MHIIQTQPEMLRFFGMDPKQVIKEIEEIKTEKENIEKNFDQKVAGYTDMWNKWVLKYKTFISG